MKGRKLLIVDDEPNIRRILQVAFERVGCTVLTAEDAVVAERMAAAESPDLVITDVTMPGPTGYELQRVLRDAYPLMPVVIMTAYGTIPQAIQAIRDGAFEYVTKPFDLESLKRVVASALEGDRKAVTPATRRSDKAPFIAESESMQEVLETVRQIADSRATVLVTGESGVGKEVVARALHTMSSRRAKPFVGVSCAAIPETLLESELFGYEKGAFTGAQGAKAGRFDMAAEGTLFLDEIGEIPHTVQVKLLRVLQERQFERLGATKATKIDVRLVTATNRDLRQAVEEGLFRLDLMYRLQVVEILIPPLRERREDILPLSRHFLQKYASENGRSPLQIEDEALNSLVNYSWPGNVRELENTMERATVLSSPDDTMLVPRLLPRTLLAA